MAEMQKRVVKSWRTMRLGWRRNILVTKEMTRTVETLKKGETVRGKATVMPGRRGLWVALGAFCVTALCGILANKFVMDYGYEGLRTGASVSRYVGAAPWTAILFALGNITVVVMVARFLWKLGEAWKMPRLHYYLTFVMAVTLILLSVFPVGYFDVEGKKSLISLVHELSARTMFIAMLLISVMLVGTQRSHIVTKVVATLYAIYGVFCVAGYLMGWAFFQRRTLIFEVAYIMLFVVVLLFVETRATKTVIGSPEEERLNKLLGKN